MSLDSHSETEWCKPMGKPTGFMEYARSVPMVRPALERVTDWREFHGHSDDTELQNQGARCMDCGVPFCHTGNMLGGAASGCPINNLIPEWNDLVYRGAGVKLSIGFVKPMTFRNSRAEFAPRHARAHAYSVSTIIQ